MNSSLVRIPLLAPWTRYAHTGCTFSAVYPDSADVCSSTIYWLEYSFRSLSILLHPRRLQFYPVCGFLHPKAHCSPANTSEMLEVRL